MQGDVLSYDGKRNHYQKCHHSLNIVLYDVVQQTSLEEKIQMMPVSHDGYTKKGSEMKKHAE